MARNISVIVSGIVGLGVIVGSTESAWAVIPAYTVQGTLTLPTPGTAFDTDATGRIIGITETGAIMRQQAVNGSAYDLAATLPSGTVQTYGPGLVRISPNGATVAIGDNGAANHVFTVPTSGLSGGGAITPNTLNAPNFEGNWSDSTTMYVSGFGTGSSVYRVNTSGGPATEVVSGVGDGSGGVAVRDGLVYIAIGYDVALMHGGEVRSFPLAALAATSGSVAFSTGTLVVQANSGGMLDFDSDGNLIESGFSGVSVFDLVAHTRYDLPGLSTGGSYTANYNDFTHEILVHDFNSASVIRYGVPAPGVCGMLGVAGLLAARRRR